MLVLVWLAVGALLGYLVARRLFGLGITMILCLTFAGLFWRSNAWGTDGMGVFAMIAFAPLGWALGTFLRTRRTLGG